MLGSYWRRQQSGNAYILLDKHAEDRNELLNQLSNYLSKELSYIVYKFANKRISEYPETQYPLSFSPRAIPDITIEKLKEDLPYIISLFWCSPQYAITSGNIIRCWYLCEKRDSIYLYIHIWRDVPNCHEYCRYKVVNENELDKILFA